MSKIDLTIPALGNKFIDLRDTIPGDSYNWNWVRSLAQVNYLVIHHTAGSDTQTAEEIANDHINNNGWGGIGYHFLIDKDGAVYYVGDISTARANVANLNEQVIGICLIGNFTGKEPTAQQIDSAKKLCDFFINSYPDLPNVNSYDSVLGHSELPNQSTPCPGDTWSSWKAKIITSPSAQFLPTESLLQQVESLQNSLALINGQFINLQQNLAEKDKEIVALRSNWDEEQNKKDQTLTIIQALVNLYKFVFLPGKVA